MVSGRSRTRRRHSASLSEVTQKDQFSAYVPAATSTSTCDAVGGPASAPSSALLKSSHMHVPLVAVIWQKKVGEVVVHDQIKFVGRAGIFGARPREKGKSAQSVRDSTPGQGEGLDGSAGVAGVAGRHRLIEVATEAAPVAVVQAQGTGCACSAECRRLDAVGAQSVAERVAIATEPKSLLVTVIQRKASRGGCSVTATFPGIPSARVAVGARAFAATATARARGSPCARSPALPRGRDTAVRDAVEPGVARAVRVALARLRPHGARVGVRGLAAARYARSDRAGEAEREESEVKRSVVLPRDQRPMPAAYDSRGDERKTLASSSGAYRARMKRHGDTIIRCGLTPTHKRRGDGRGLGWWCERGTSLAPR
jgi:hypothetical protein